MKLTDSNVFIMKHGPKYHRICIAMPDGSRNYLHCDIEMELQTAVENRDVLVNERLVNNYLIDEGNIRIIPDGTYYRLFVVVGNSPQLDFHSRKLNVNDAVYERMQLLVADD